MSGFREKPALSASAAARAPRARLIGSSRNEDIATPQFLQACEAGRIAPWKRRPVPVGIRIDREEQ